MKLWVVKGRRRIRTFATAIRGGDIIYADNHFGDSMIGPLRVICDPLIFSNGYDIPVQTCDSTQHYFDLVYRRNQ